MISEQRMVTIVKSFSFDSAHVLPWHNGKCKNLHGHTYRLEVSISGALNENGIVCDFSDVSALVKKEIVEKYDHKFLNDFFDNPTAENMAVSFHGTIKGFFPENYVKIKLHETPTSWAEYGG